MTDLLKEAEAIRDEYKSRTRQAGIPFQDAVIAFLYLIIKFMIEKKTTNKK